MTFVSFMAEDKEALTTLSSKIEARLCRGAEQLGITLSSSQQRQLLGYLQLLSKWNRAYNLTSVRESDKMLSRHLLDSLSIAKHLQGRRFIDVGSGGGLPGIPQAIVFTDRQFTLLDSNGKKSRFLLQAIRELGLGHVDVVHSRVEEYQPTVQYDGVISRAFSSLDAMLAGCRHLLTRDGRYYAMKGKLPEQELQHLPADITVVSCLALAVPELSERRHLIILSHMDTGHNNRQ